MPGAKRPNALGVRKGIDGLCRLAETQLGGDVYAGALFVFVSRGRDRIKILSWDAGGFVVYYKRLESGRFRLPCAPAGASRIGLDAAELTMLLAGIDLNRVRRPALWEPKVA